MGKSGRHGGFQSGFSLIELMVTIAVAAILLAIAIPSFEEAINTSRLSTASNEMMAGLQAARMEAIRTNQRVALCLSPAPQAATPSCNATGATGWVVFRDVNHDGSVNASTDVVRVGSSHNQVQMLNSTAFGSTVTFRSDGLAYDASNNPLQGAVQFCIPSTHPANNLRFVNVNGGSRVSIVKNTGNGACPTTVNNNNTPP